MLVHMEKSTDSVKIREDRRDGFRKIHGDRHDGFVQSSEYKTCKRLEKTDGKTKNQCNKCDVLNPTESGLEVEEVHAVDVV